MPLTERISFKTALQKGNRIQVPRLIRWQFKMEPQQVLKVTVQPDGLGYSEEEFFSRMSKDGRIGKSKLILKLQQGENDEESLAGSVWKVELEPAEGVS